MTTMQIIMSTLGIALMISSAALLWSLVRLHRARARFNKTVMDALRSLSDSAPASDYPYVVLAEMPARTALAAEGSDAMRAAWGGDQWTPEQRAEMKRADGMVVLEPNQIPPMIRAQGSPPEAIDPQNPENRHDDQPSPVVERGRERGD